MASRYTPQLTAWRTAEGDCVGHEGTVYAVRRRRREDGDAGVVEDERDCVEIGGKVFPVAEEKEVAVHGGRVVRCVEYPTDSGAVLRLTVTTEVGGAKKEVAEIVESDGALRVLELECGGSYYETAAGTWEHVVDVQGQEAAFVLLVSVRQEEARIVRIHRLN
ncbi:unnamed protein product [Alopecurus aequalis]